MRTHNILLVLCVLVTGALPGVVAAQVSGVDVKGLDNDVTSVKKSYLYTSQAGRFQVMLPGGCAKVRRRDNGDEGGTVEDQDTRTVQVAMISCDRFEKTGQGCSVTAIFNLTDGKQGNPGPPQVLRQVRKLLQQYSAQIQHQAEISREFPSGKKVEGVDVKAGVPGGDGEIWVRGLLSGADIYLLAAWNQEGGLWSDTAYQEFFNSFEPLNE